MKECLQSDPSDRDVPNAGLLRLGYTPREAEFLRLVATQSGYFLRRQYTQFLGKAPGGTVAALTQKGFARNQLSVATVGRMQVYHVAARSVYNALGLGDNRNRRQRQTPTIQNKLMGLDYVLEHPHQRYLATESEKVDHFVSVRGVAIAELPSQRFGREDAGPVVRRFFVEKFPLFVAPPRGGLADSYEGFCFVDEGLTTTARFGTFLDHYAALFRVLPRFEVVYVAATERLFDAATRMFQRRFGPRAGHDSPHDPATLDPSVESYFRARSLFESGDFESFDRTKLITLREQRTAFSSAEVEARYAIWRAHQAKPSTANRAVESSVIHAPCGRFSTCLLRHNYEVFELGHAF